jgi:hypothetical protein
MLLTAEQVASVTTHAACTYQRAPFLVHLAGSFAQHVIAQHQEHAVAQHVERFSGKDDCAASALLQSASTFNHRCTAATVGPGLTLINITTTGTNFRQVTLHSLASSDACMHAVSIHQCM